MKRNAGSGLFLIESLLEVREKQLAANTAQKSSDNIQTAATKLSSNDTFQKNAIPREEPEDLPLNLHIPPPNKRSKLHDHQKDKHHQQEYQLQQHQELFEALKTLFTNNTSASGGGGDANEALGALKSDPGSKTETLLLTAFSPTETSSSSCSVSNEGGGGGKSVIAKNAAGCFSMEEERETRKRRQQKAEQTVNHQQKNTDDPKHFLPSTKANDEIHPISKPSDSKVNSKVNPNFQVQVPSTITTPNFSASPTFSMTADQTRFFQQAFLGAMATASRIGGVSGWPPVGLFGDQLGNHLLISSAEKHLSNSSSERASAGDNGHLFGVFNMLAQNNNHFQNLQQQIPGAFSLSVSNATANLASNIAAALRRNHQVQQQQQGQQQVMQKMSKPTGRNGRKKHHHHSHSHRQLLPPTGGLLEASFAGLISAAAGHHRHHRRSSTSTKKYRCDICDKTFSRSNTLITHKRIHTGEKPFECNQCGRAFRQPGNLTRHAYTHTTVKPFICTECGKAFNRASNLQTHQKIHANVGCFSSSPFNEAEEMIGAEDVGRHHQCPQCRLRFTYAEFKLHKCMMTKISSEISECCTTNNYSKED